MTPMGSINVVVNQGPSLIPQERDWHAAMKHVAFGIDMRVKNKSPVFRS